MELIKTYAWRIKGTPRVGNKAKAQGRAYEIVDHAPHVTKAGRVTKLILWKGTCIVCGEKFTFTTGASKFSATATCEYHRHMGADVAARSKKAKLLSGGDAS
jgi:hypothetical protein